MSRAVQDSSFLIALYSKSVDELIEYRKGMAQVALLSVGAIVGYISWFALQPSSPNLSIVFAVSLIVGCFATWAVGRIIDQRIRWVLRAINNIQEEFRCWDETAYSIGAILPAEWRYSHTRWSEGVIRAFTGMLFLLMGAGLSLALVKGLGFSISGELNGATL